MFDIKDYGKIVSFDTYAPGILSNNFSNVKLMSIVDYDTARRFENVDSLAVKVQPSLPDGSPRDYKNFNYLKIKTQAGDIRYIALEWINNDSITHHQEVIITFKVVARNIDTTETIRKFLIGNNIKVVDISTG